MQTVKIEVVVGKESHELASGITNLIDEIRKTLADGYSPGEDIPAVLMAAVQHLIPAVQGLENIPDEIEENKVAFIKTMALMGGDLYDVLTKTYEKPVAKV